MVDVDSVKVKVKVKVYPVTAHEGPYVEQRYNSTLSLTSALDGGVCSMPRPGRLFPRERPVTHCIGCCVGPQGRSGRVRKISSPPGFDLRTVQPLPTALSRTTAADNDNVIIIIIIIIIINVLIHISIIFQVRRKLQFKLEVLIYNAL
jgi:hypothetical protein